MRIARTLDGVLDRALTRRLLADIHATATRPWTIMEVCGSQTHTLGIETPLPDGIRVIHGPGCPVCVTPPAMGDRALAIAAHSGVIFCTPGDAGQVAGADVRVVLTPLDAVRLAREHPDRQVVYFAIGFELTAPATALAVLQASDEELDNFSVLVSHIMVPPAMTDLLESAQNDAQAFVVAGHVSEVMGWTGYEPLARRYHVPIVVTGFQTLDLLEGVLLAVRQLELGRAEVENQPLRENRDDGDIAATTAMRRVFRVTERAWRGIGSLSATGLSLAPEFTVFDAALRFRAQMPGVVRSTLDQ